MPTAGALNRAEWLKFMGLFFNMDDSANTIFNEINSSYYSKSAAYKQAAGPSPMTVAWLNRATAALYGADAFEVSYAPYKVQYTRDAGGNMTSQAVLGNMTNVVESPVTPNTLWFSWDAADAGATGGFKTEADAIAAFHSFLRTVSQLGHCCIGCGGSAVGNSQVYCCVAKCAHPFCLQPPVV